jgi:hypothetical protein
MERQDKKTKTKKLNSNFLFTCTPLNTNRSFSQYKIIGIRKRVVTIGFTLTNIAQEGHVLDTVVLFSKN